MITSKSQITIFAIHPPWCHESRRSFWSFTPIIIRANIAKNKKFPKLTRRTACIWYHCFECVSEELIPTKKHQKIVWLGKRSYLDTTYQSYIDRMDWKLKVRGDSYSASISLTVWNKSSIQLDLFNKRTELKLGNLLFGF